MSDSFTASVTDADGNTSGVSAALIVTVDPRVLAAPVIASLSSDTDNAGGGIDGNGLTLVDSAEANSTVCVFDEGLLLETTTAVATEPGN